ncbi:MAG: hypothetical protein P4L67_01645 [Candidatus Pacebacteria bacterium]|nr:hypothetical protein [Candidatus Paceibacterota bacterium]
MTDDYLRDQQNKFENSAASYRQEANEVFRELVQQLILVGTVILTVSVFIFNVPALSMELVHRDKVLLFTAWIFIASSLLCGIVQYVLDYYFFRTWTNAQDRIVDGICNTGIDEINIGTKVEDIQKNIPSASSPIPVFLQIFTLACGIVFLLVVMGHLLFLLS